jgi:hypothetical protein
MLQFVHDHGLVLFWCFIGTTLIGWGCHARMRRLRERDRRARDVEDALLQDAQGLILKVQGLVKQLDEGDPMRKSVEQALDRADEKLSEDRDRVQDLRE